MVKIAAAGETSTQGKLMNQAKSLIHPDRLPHTSLRTGEIYLKRQVFKVEDGSVRRIEALYTTLFRDLRAHALVLSDSLGIRTLDNSAAAHQWRDRMLETVRQRVTILTQAVNSEALRAASAALTGAYYGRLWLLDMATTADVKLPLLHASALTEDIYSDLIQSLLGKQWREQYATEMDDLTLQIRRALGTALVNGDGIQDAMNGVADAMGITIDRRRGALGSATRKGYRANFNRVQTLTRTIINQVSNDGAISAYRANSDILDGYEWLTAEDERVCPICDPLDGKQFGMKSNFRPPIHPQCRCTIIPVVKAGMLEHPKAMPKTTFAKWSQAHGMDNAIADFLVPKAA